MRSQHRDHGVTLRSDNCGVVNSAVNSIAQTCLEPAVLEQSKFGIKAIPKMRSCLRSHIVRRRGRASKVLLYGSLSPDKLSLSYLIR
jgi:hypothetical protein